MILAGKIHFEMKYLHLQFKQGLKTTRLNDLTLTFSLAVLQGPSTA